MQVSRDSGTRIDEVAAGLYRIDLFTQPGAGDRALTEADIREPGEAMRAALDYHAHGRDTGALLERLAGEGPRALACTHGSAWTGDGTALRRALAGRLVAGVGAPRSGGPRGA